MTSKRSVSLKKVLPVVMAMAWFRLVVRAKGASRKLPEIDIESLAKQLRVGDIVSGVYGISGSSSGIVKP